MKIKTFMHINLLHCLKKVCLFVFKIKSIFFIQVSVAGALIELDTDLQHRMLYKSFFFLGYEYYQR